MVKEMKGYFMLKNAIIALAVDDYRRTKFSDNLRGKRINEGEDISQIEDFFVSNWGELLSDGEGEYIVRILREEKAYSVKGKQIYDRFIV